MQPRQPRQCKFGDNCRKLADGTCTFYHPNQPQQGGMGKMTNPNMGMNPNFSGGMRGQGYQGQGNYPNQGQGNFQGQQGQGNYPNQGMGNYPRPNQGNYPNQGSGNFPNQGKGPQGGFNQQQGGYNKPYDRPPNQNPMYNNPNQPPKHDEYTQKFCMNYQYNQKCKYYEQKGKCGRIHGFDEQGKIRRIAFDNTIPPQQPSKLGKFVSGGQTYLILRMGNKIAILTFNQENSQFGIAKEWSFPKPELNYSYYSQKENFIYLSAENPKTTLFDIFVYDMMTGVLITIEEAHQGNVTDVIHFSNEILLSGSKDGSIKVWKIAGQTATLDQAASDNIFKTYVQGKAPQILFLDLSTVNGMKVLSAGTSDNRVLFFLGDQFQYYPLVLPQKHASAFKIRYCTMNQVTLAFVVTWASDTTMSSVVAVNLNDFKISQVVTHNTKENPRNNIYLMEIIQDKLFIANMQGTVTIYSLPVINKIGAMLHKNTVNSIVPSEYITKTNIKIPQMFVLESKYNDKNGSIGVYTIKN